MGKVIGQDDKKTQLILTEWATFSKTTAFKELMQYMDDNRQLLHDYAEERVMPSPIDGKKIAIDSETSNSLLQNARGINIVRTYIRLRSE